jgi:DNA-binding response OmpR family regulator
MYVHSNASVILYNDTHYIGLTGNALESDITYFLSCGANEVMTKPFNLSLFNELMKNYQLNSSRNDFQ